MSNFNDNLITKWRGRFEICVRLTLILPLGLAALQLALVGNQLSFDITKLSTWTNVEKVFALPLGAFALLAAITSLIGLYHRSMLLSRQLEKVQEQIAIANRQFKRSDEQFALAQTQLKISQNQFYLVQKKENFMLYIEHSKAFRETVESQLKGLKRFVTDFMKVYEVEHKFGVEVNYLQFYPALFPVNTSELMSRFSLVTEVEADGLADNIKEQLELIFKKESSTSSNLFYDDFSQLFALLRYYGLHINVGAYYRNNGIDKVWLANMLLDLQMLVLVFRYTGLIREVDANAIQSVCISQATEFLEDYIAKKLS